MRQFVSFALIGAGAFTAGVFYPTAGIDSLNGTWLPFAVSAMVAVAGLIDLMLVASRGRGPLWVKPLQ